MHTHSRLVSVLSHLNQSPAPKFDIQRLEQNLCQIFGGIQHSQPETKRIVLSACVGEPDPGEPSDRFVSLSRNLQKEKSRKDKDRPVYRPRQPVSEDKTPLEHLLDPRVLLGVASTGLALAFLPSSSPVSRSLLVSFLFISKLLLIILCSLDCGLKYYNFWLHIWCIYEKNKMKDQDRSELVV